MGAHGASGARALGAGESILMISTGMMIALILWYLGIVVASAFEGNWPRALYFVGAIVISVAVLWMTTDGKGGT